VTVTVAENLSPASATGTVTIGGQVVTVNQAGAGCTYSLSSAGTSMPSSGGPTSVNVTTPGGCAWTVDPGPSWVTVVSGGSGIGPGTVNLSIAANSTTVARSAGVLIGGQTYLVTQAGVPCSFSLSASSTVQPSAGGSGVVEITASGAGCPWVASSNAAWLTLSAASGSGSGSITFTAVANPNPGARSGTLTVAGQNIVVNQSGITCSYALRSPSALVPSGGGPSAVGVIAAAGCAWTAVSNAPSWINVTGGASSSGTANVDFRVAPNPAGVERTGTLTIAGLTFPVTQAATPCTITLTPASHSAGEFGGSSSFTYTTSVSGCPHTVQSYTSWLTVTGATYGGTSGSVNFTVAPNTFTAARSGVIKVGDQSFTVNQAASTCAYVLTSLGATFGRLGGDGAASVTFSPPACGPAVLVLGPPGMITLGPLSAGGGMYTQNYSVSIYQSFINYVRTAQILLSGQTYTVKQTSW
jgi:hypothetical protein